MEIEKPAEGEEHLALRINHSRTPTKFSCHEREIFVSARVLHIIWTFSTLVFNCERARVYRVFVDIDVSAVGEGRGYLVANPVAFEVRWVGFNYRRF